MGGPDCSRRACGVGNSYRRHSWIKSVAVVLDVILKSFETPDDIQLFARGKFEVVNIGGLTIGRATYEPGWKWSVDVGPQIGEDLCSVEHVGMVISGTATAAFEDGRVIELRPGNLFYIPPEPHDSWVVGDEPYVSLHFLGADKYAQSDQ